MIKMKWDTIFINWRNVGTYKNGEFITRRDPSKHTLVKLNAYGFNVELLEQMKRYRADSTILVKQVWTKIKLRKSVADVLENWVYLVFNWEKQVFVKKSEFAVEI